MNSQVNIQSLLNSGATTESALELFDQLETVHTEEMIGQWRGEGFPTNHPMDGMLENFNWWGKEFRSTEDVHPLVFQHPGKSKTTLDPLWMPLKYARNSGFARFTLTRKAFQWLTPFMKTQKPRARLRMLEYRGKVSATMVYDHKPINDVFRKVDDDTLLGAMDLKGMSRPFFFILKRHS